MLYALLVAYVLGGVTFVPLLAGAVLYVIYVTSPVVEKDLAARLSVREEKEKQDAEVRASLERDTGVPRLYKAGWLTVRRTYEPVQLGDGTYMGMISQGYRNFLDNRSKDPKRTRPKDHFYVVLKQNVLFLYEDETQVDCAAAIEVTLHDISLYPPAKLDGELYVKRRAIRLMARGTQPKEDNEKREGSDDNVRGRPMPWYVFSKNNVEKEDWYHTLIASSKLAGDDAAATFAKDASLFNPDDMAKLIDGIDNQPDPIPMRWLNAMVGRIFLSAYRTDGLESYIIGRIMRKIARVKTPTFLSGIQVREVNVGSTTPFFSKPMLKELTIDGDASMELHMNYQGSFRVTVETVATINLGARFKPYTVNLVLAVVVKELEGNLLVKMKRPPTNRIWYGFTMMPRMVMQVEPVVSTRQIKWSMILKPIESRIREIILESFVVPNLDDQAFFPTGKYEHMGGIWGDAARQEVLVSVDAEASAAAAGEEGKEKAEGAEAGDGQGEEGAEKTGNDLAGGAEAPSAPEKLAGGPSSVSISSTQSAPVPAETTRRRPWFGSSRKPSIGSTPPRPTSTDPTAPGEGTEDAAARLREVLRVRSESPKVVASSSIDDIISGQRTLSRSMPLPTVELPDGNQSEDDGSAGRSRSTSTLGLESPKPPMASKSSSSSVESSNSIALSTTSEDRTVTASPERSSPSMVHRVPPAPSKSFTPKPTNLPPPRRHAPSHSVDSSSTRSASPVGKEPPSANSSTSMLSQWKSRATDKEAIAAGYSQAKDTMKKWGAAWQAKRRQTSTPQPHFTNGFNPIDIDALDTDKPQPSPDLMDMRMGGKEQGSSPGGSRRASLDGSDSSSSETKSYREHRAALAKKAMEQFALDASKSEPSRPAAAPSALTALPLPQPSAKESLLPEGDTLPRSRRKSAASKSVVSFSLDDSPKRSKSITTSHGQFLPAAPQSTRSLSVSSAKLDHPSSNPSSPPTSPPVTGKTAEPVSPRVHAVSMSSTSSGGASYRPAPTMTIPGIKDSSHRFALGSDSASRPRTTSSSKSSFTSAQTGSTPSSPVPPNALDENEGKSNGVPNLDVVLPSPPPPVATELPPTQPGIKKTLPTPPQSASSTSSVFDKPGQAQRADAMTAVDKTDGPGGLKPPPEDDGPADGKVSTETVRPTAFSTKTKEGQEGASQEADYGEAYPSTSCLAIASFSST